MKFESKFGVGEICIYNQQPPLSREMDDLLVKVVAVIFNGEVTEYSVENITRDRAIQRVVVKESQLTGDPDFDQEKGCYPQVINR